METAATPRQAQPKGLYLLFATEMWERLSYYGMRALLVLYLTDATRGGFGWSHAEALKLYGLYTGLVYFTPVIGGFCADRFLGQRLAVIFGGVMMMVGHFLMALPGLYAFYAALGFLIVGNGFFKPNISSMVGGLYRQGDARRDGAFTIFYMGINLGAFLSSYVCGTLGERLGWHWGFGSAGVGMGIGLLSFLLGAKRLLGDVGMVPPRRNVAESAVPQKPLTRDEIDRVLVILVLSFFTIIFWAGFEQAGGLMNLYTHSKVDRSVFGWEIPTSWFQSVNPFFILLLGPVFAELWVRLSTRGKDPSSAVKMSMGFVLLAVGFLFMVGAAQQSSGGGKANLFWLVAAYLFHTAGELCLSPVGLSMVTKLAPARYVSMLMGTWFLFTAMGNYLAGFIGSYVEKLGEAELFTFVGAMAATAAVVLFVLSPKLKRMTHGAEQVRTTEAPTAETLPADVAEGQRRLA